jgi:hypothetical protein
MAPCMQAQLLNITFSHLLCPVHGSMHARQLLKCVEAAGRVLRACRYEQTGCAGSMFANRLSFTYDFRGPSKTVDTGAALLHEAIPYHAHGLASRLLAASGPYLDKRLSPGMLQRCQSRCAGVRCVEDISLCWLHVMWAPESMPLGPHMLHMYQLEAFKS